MAPNDEGPRVYKAAPKSDLFTAGHCPNNHDPIHDRTTWTINVWHVIAVMVLVWGIIGGIAFWIWH